MFDIYGGWLLWKQIPFVPEVLEVLLDLEILADLDGLPNLEILVLPIIEHIKECKGKSFVNF